MSTRTLYRWSAATLIVSAVSVTVGRILHPAGDAAGITSAQWGWSHLLWLAGLLTGMLGVTALYPRQRAQLGRLGFAGAAAAWLGMGLLSGAIYFEAIIEPGLLNRVPELVDILLDAAAMRLYLTVFLTSVGLFALGFLLFGIAMLRARVLPRWAITSSSAAWWETPKASFRPSWQRCPPCARGGPGRPRPRAMGERRNTLHTRSSNGAATTPESR